MSFCGVIKRKLSLALTYVKKIIFPNIIKFLAAEFGEFYQAIGDFRVEHSASVGGEEVVSLLVENPVGNIRFPRVLQAEN